MSTEMAKVESSLPAVQQQGGDSFLAIIAAAARDSQVDPAKMTALLELKERIDAKQGEIEFNQAFAAMAMELPRIVKKGVKDMGAKGAIPYGKWEDIDTAIRPILARHQFVMSFQTRLTDGKLVMACILSHIAGHAKESYEPVVSDPGPGRNDTQARGSGRSYSKRYLAKDMLNLIEVGEDDDGKRAHAITQEQADNINSLISEIGMTPQGREAFFRLADIKSVEEIQAHRYKDLVQALDSKRRAKAGPK